MDTALKTKIQKRRQAWELALQKKNEFVGHKLQGEPFVGHNPFELALVYADEQRAFIYYELSLVEAYPDAYVKESIEYFKREVERLNKNIRAYKNGQWPSSSRD